MGGSRDDGFMYGSWYGLYTGVIFKVKIYQFRLFSVQNSAIFTKKKQLKGHCVRERN